VSDVKEVYAYPWGNDEIKNANGCGFNGLSSYSFEKNNQWDSREKVRTMSFRGGCGFAGASFKDTPECKAVYEAMALRFPIAFQTPVRKNSHHREKAHTGTFYVIWDTSKEIKKEQLT
jgi:hypothetical protein